MNDEPKTVRVRIAVAVKANGAWTAFGRGGDFNDYSSAERAKEGLIGDCSVCFVEADVPLPQSSTVEGKVVP